MGAFAMAIKSNIHIVPYRVAHQSCLINECADLKFIPYKLS